MPGSVHSRTIRADSPPVRLAAASVSAVTRTDGELLAAHVAGDRYAFGELADRHARLLWTLARRSLDDERDAAEAVQDALLRAHRYAARFRGQASVRTWLVRLVISSCRDRYRHNRARGFEHPVEDTVLARVASGADPFAAHDLRVELSAALARLPSEQRLALVLVSVLGFATSEAAELLEVPVGTVKSRRTRAKARLHQLLAEHQLAQEGA
jgi:RNA polymerase sigma-70 factor, ECF subfamily